MKWIANDFIFRNLLISQDKRKSNEVKRSTGVHNISCGLQKNMYMINFENSPSPTWHKLCTSLTQFFILFYYFFLEGGHLHAYAFLLL